MMYRIVRIVDNRTDEWRAAGRPPFADEDPYAITLAPVYSDSLGEEFDLPMGMVIILEHVSRSNNRAGTLAVGMEFWLYANPVAESESSPIDHGPGKTVNCFYAEAQREKIFAQFDGDDAP